MAVETQEVKRKVMPIPVASIAPSESAERPALQTNAVREEEAVSSWTSESSPEAAWSSPLFLASLSAIVWQNWTREVVLASAPLFSWWIH